MFRLREFFIELARLLVIGDSMAGRVIRLVALAVALGLPQILQKPFHVLTWGPRLPPVYREPSLGLSLVVVGVIVYVLIAVGAAWARAGRLDVAFRDPECASCHQQGIYNIEVWNRGRMKPIDDVNVFVDWMRPGFTGRRQLGWLGENPAQTGLTLRAGGHAHVCVLDSSNAQTGVTYSLMVGPPQHLVSRHVARLVVESLVGSKRATLILDPSATPPLRIKRAWQSCSSIS
jgi:hypothetical protein